MDAWAAAGLPLGNENDFPESQLFHSRGFNTSCLDLFLELPGSLHSGRQAKFVVV